MWTTYYTVTFNESLNNAKIILATNFIINTARCVFTLSLLSGSNKNHSLRYRWLRTWTIIVILIWSLKKAYPIKSLESLLFFWMWKSFVNAYWLPRETFTFCLRDEIFNFYKILFYNKEQRKRIFRFIILSNNFYVICNSL